MTAPLTTAKLGSTRCLGCERLFTETPQPTIDVETSEQNRNRYGGLSGPQGSRTVARRWHTVCLEAFNAKNDALRAKVAAEHEATMRAMCEAAGLDYEEVLARTQERA